MRSRAQGHMGAGKLQPEDWGENSRLGVAEGLEEGLPGPTASAPVLSFVLPLSFGLGSVGATGQLPTSQAHGGLTGHVLPAA